MHEQLQDRIRMPRLREQIVSAAIAAAWIEDGMTVGMSGFTRAGDAKAVPLALVERAAHDPLKITLITGASLGEDLDGQLASSGVLARRMPFQVDPVMRAAINCGEVMHIDQHLSDIVELLRTKQIAPIDIAVIEAIAITETGAIIPTTSIGNSASFAVWADKVIVEINLSHTMELEGMHDIFYPPKPRSQREPLGITSPMDRIGSNAIEIAPEKSSPSLSPIGPTVRRMPCRPTPRRPLGRFYRQWLAGDFCHESDGQGRLRLQHRADGAACGS